MSDTLINEVSKTVESGKTSVQYPVRAADGGEIRTVTIESQAVRDNHWQIKTGDRVRDNFATSNIVLNKPLEVGSMVGLPDGTVWKVSQPDMQAEVLVKSLGEQMNEQVFVKTVPQNETQGQEVILLTDLPLSNETRGNLNLWKDSQGKELNSFEIEAQRQQGTTSQMESIQAQAIKAEEERNVREERMELAKVAMVPEHGIKSKNLGEEMGQAAASYLQERSAIRNGVAEKVVGNRARISLDRGTQAMLKDLGGLTSEETGYAQQALVLSVMRTMPGEEQDRGRVAENIKTNRREVLDRGERQNWLGRTFDRQGSTSDRLNEIDDHISEHVLAAVDKKKQKDLPGIVVDAVDTIRVMVGGQKMEIDESQKTDTSLHLSAESVQTQMQINAEKAAMTAEQRLALSQEAFQKAAAQRDARIEALRDKQPQSNPEEAQQPVRGLSAEAVARQSQIYQDKQVAEKQDWTQRNADAENAAKAKRNEKIAAILQTETVAQ